MPPTERNEISHKAFHRIAGRRAGKPLWEYSSVEQFVRAMICVVEAHKVLSDNGIVHGDIGGANILIDVKLPEVTGEDYVPEDYPVEETRAFLTDFELASVPLLPERDRVYRVPVDRNYDDQPAMGAGVSGDVKARLPSHSSYVNVHEKAPPRLQAGDVMMGTAIFTSLRVLDAAVSNESVVRTTKDDLESIGWVMFYTVYRHGLQDEEGLERMTTKLSEKDTSLSKDVVREDFRNEFDSLFSATSLEKLYFKRASRLSPYADPWIRHTLPYLWEYAVNCEAGGYGRCLAGLIMVVWAMLRRFQVSANNYKLSDNPMMAEWEERYEQIEAGGVRVVRDSPPAKPSHDDFLANLNLAMQQILQIKAEIAKATMSE
ncbi:hypothetical protein C8T65DRAFT_730873 [Cerioporus squamosus]|nr:hypothetical protein C8T65DRAFT_730873 [Cerioporus squamosus]